MDVDRQPGNLGVLHSTAKTPDDSLQAAVKVQSREDYVGGVHVDWPAAITSLIVLFIVMALSLQRIFRLDEKLLAVMKGSQAKKLAREHDAIEKARRDLEARFSQDE